MSMFNRSPWSGRKTITLSVTSLTAAAMNKSRSRDDIEKRLRKIEKEETKAAKVWMESGWANKNDNLNCTSYQLRD